ncbi:MAG: hypothetical protein AAFR58_24145 [Cyanobacteria bacterium J06627_28]
MSLHKTAFKFLAIGLTSAALISFSSVIDSAIASDLDDEVESAEIESVEIESVEIESVEIESVEAVEPATTVTIPVDETFVQSVYQSSQGTVEVEPEFSLHAFFFATQPIPENDSPAVLLTALAGMGLVLAKKHSRKQA